MNSDVILEEITSGDAHKIWAGAHAIIHLKDEARLMTIARHLADIRKTTSGVELGGLFCPNKYHLQFAIKKLEFVALPNPKPCICSLYPEYMMFSPMQEEAAGSMRIVQTFLLEGSKYVDHYLCECLSCGIQYRVEEREYHYTWWAWTSIA